MREVESATKGLAIHPGRGFSEMSVSGAYPRAALPVTSRVGLRDPRSSCTYQGPHNERVLAGICLLSTHGYRRRLIYPPVHFNRALLSHHLGMVPCMVRNFRSSTLKCSAFRQARFQSTNPHFYQNRQLEQYAAREAQRLSLRQLVTYLVHTENCAI